MASDGKEGEVSAQLRKKQVGMAQQGAGSSQRPKMSTGVGAARKLMHNQVPETVSVVISCFKS
jgi:hypothetical protein